MGKISDVSYNNTECTLAACKKNLSPPSASASVQPSRCAAAAVLPQTIIIATRGEAFFAHRSDWILTFKFQIERSLAFHSCQSN